MPKIGGDLLYRFILQRETSTGLEDIEFPIAPERFTTKVGNKNKTIDLVKMGEINIPKSIGLREFSFKILLPKDDTLITGTKLYVNSSGDIQDTTNWVKMNFHEPIWYLSKIREMKATPNQKVFLVIIRELVDGFNDDGTAITKQLFGGNLTVKIEDYTVEENAGEEGDFWVNIKLKEHRQVGITTHFEETGTVDEDGKIEATEVIQREDTKIQPQTYTVQESDTSLWAIAKRFLGDGTKWKDLYELNKDVISDPNVIIPGMVIRLNNGEEIHEPTIDEGSFTMTVGGGLVYNDGIAITQTGR